MTFNVDEHWGITVTHGEKIGPKRWQAIAQAFRRDTMENVGGKFVGIGTTMKVADPAAQKKAEHFVSLQGKPKDWKSRS